MKPVSAFKAGAGLRSANLFLLVLWLWSQTRKGLLVSVAAPAGTVFVYAAANAALAFRPAAPPAWAETALIAADIALVAWAGSWPGTPHPDAVLALLVPLFMAAVRLRPLQAALATVLAAAALGLLTPPPRLEAAYRAALVLASPWGLALFARSSLRSSAANVRERTGLARSLFFHEFLSLLLFQIRDYLSSLTAVATHLERAAAGGSEKELAGKLAHMVVELNGKLKRMSETVDEHNTTRRPARAPEWDLEALARECLDSAAASYPIQGLRTRVWVDPRLGPMSGDRDGIAAAFTAVFENALDAFLAAGRGGRITVSAILEGDQAVVTVIDDAGGVPGETADQLFKPLFTTKSSLGGVGLGLAMSRRLLERAGGTLTLRSENGRAFARLEIPLRPGLPRVRNEESTWAGRRSSVS
ncbi:MAG: HAMP domain-containing histidine kinase [Elusimicrobia bacterium]|nr:HAMP domain-containing histidine kinase [Elusimicrobiota bacterium]